MSDEAQSSAVDSSGVHAEARDVEQLHATIASLQEENARLWRSYELLKEELALVKRRLFVAKAERVDTSELQLEFEELLGRLAKLAGESASTAASNQDPKGDRKPERKHKPRGRRKLEDADLPEVVVEVPDPIFEQLVAAGKATRLNTFERSSKAMYQRGGMRRVVINRCKYKVIDAQGETAIETAPVPLELIERCIASAATLAFVAVSKFCDGLPLYRIEQLLERNGFGFDRGTMSRWLEQLGAVFGATVIEAARAHAFATAFCIMTDATGFAIQPGPKEDGPRRPCRKGHYFVQLADRDYIFFEYTPKETSASVRAMFQGFSGYLQLDAKSVYDVLFRPPDVDDPDDDGCIRHEVGCWSHARRKYWEAALAKQRPAREALVRIGKIFEVDARLCKGNPPTKVKALRDQHLRPLVLEFLDFATEQYELCKHERGSARTAFGYCVRQRDALTRFLDDGRLRLDNNPSESALRKVVIIRDSALFAGSDDHATSAGHILSLIAMARLHNLDPEQYLRDLVRVLPYWPRERYLELAPKFWTATRAGIDSIQLGHEVGVIDVPPCAANTPQ